MRAARIGPERSGYGPAPVLPPDALPPQESAPPKPSIRLRTALVWGGVGFIAGAIFWHAVGFWSFLSEVVLNRTPGAKAAAMSAAPTRPKDSLPIIVLVDADHCTALTLDRRSKLTESRPCPKNGLALRLAPDSGAREDLTVLAQPDVQAARAD